MFRFAVVGCGYMFVAFRLVGCGCGYCYCVGFGLNCLVCELVIALLVGVIAVGLLLWPGTSWFVYCCG